jgi:hypothetical protein
VLFRSFGCEKRRIVGVVDKVNNSDAVLTRVNNWLDGGKYISIAIAGLIATALGLVQLSKMMGWL